MSRDVINTNIRLNLSRPEDRRAWEYLQRLDRKRYKSYTRAVVAAVNHYFSRQEHLAADPYLETREKEDAFLQRVLDTIEKGMAESKQDGMLTFIQSLQSRIPIPQSESDSKAIEEDLDVALDFVNSL